VSHFGKKVAFWQERRVLAGTSRFGRSKHFPLVVSHDLLLGEPQTKGDHEDNFAKIAKSF